MGKFFIFSSSKDPLVVIEILFIPNFFISKIILSNLLYKKGSPPVKATFSIPSIKIELINKINLSKLISSFFSILFFINSPSP